MFLIICKLHICIQNVFGHIFYRSRLHLYRQFWQFEVQKLAYMLILAAGGMIPYLSSVPPHPTFSDHTSPQKKMYIRYISVVHPRHWIRNFSSAIYIVPVVLLSVIWNVPR